MFYPKRSRELETKQFIHNQIPMSLEFLNYYVDFFVYKAFEAYFNALLIFQLKSGC